MLSMYMWKQNENSMSRASTLDKFTKSTEVGVYSYDGGLWCDLSMLPLANRCSRLIWSADEKASLILPHFDAKQRGNCFQQPLSSDHCPVLRYVVFRSNFVRSLLLDLDSYGGNDPDGMLPIFYKQVAWELAPNLGCNYLAAEIVCKY